MSWETPSRTGSGNYPRTADGSDRKTETTDGKTGLLTGVLFCSIYGFVLYQRRNRNEKRTRWHTRDDSLRDSLEHCGDFYQASALAWLCGCESAQPDCGTDHCGLYGASTASFCAQPEDPSLRDLCRERIYLLCDGKQADYRRKRHRSAVYGTSVYPGFFRGVFSSENPQRGPRGRTGGTGRDYTVLF